MEKRRGRRPGPNYARNQAAAAKRLMNSGLIIPEVVAPQRAQVESQLTEDLAVNFLKSITKIKESMAHVRGQHSLQQIGNKQVVMDDDKARLMTDGVILRPSNRLRESDLREVANASTLLGAIHQVYADDGRRHGTPDKAAGFVWKLRDKEKKPSGADKARIYEKERLVEYMGDKTLPTWESRDRLEDCLEMAIRDTLTIDKVAWLRTKNRRGQIIDVTYLDPATIFRTDPKLGYRGDQSITHVQVVDGNVVETYETGRIILRNRSKISDIRMRGHGWSPVESCIFEVMGGVHAMKHNMDRFNGRNPPKMIMSAKNNISQAMMDLLEEIWEMSFAGDSMEFRLPLVHGVEDLKVHSLQTEQDGIFPQFLQNCFSLILARYGMDAAEIGLNFSQSKTLSEPSIDGRAQFSRNRRHAAIMSFMERCIREIFDDESEKNPLVFAFTGILVEDEDKRLDRIAKQLSNFVPLDQVLAQNDMPSYGEFAANFFEDKEDPRLAKLKLLGMSILNPQFMQSFDKIIGDQQQQPGMGDMGGMGGAQPQGQPPGPGDDLGDFGDDDSPSSAQPEFKFDDEDDFSGGQSDSIDESLEPAQDGEGED